MEEEGGGERGFLKGERVMTGTRTGDLRGLLGEVLVGEGGITFRTRTGVKILLEKNRIESVN